MAENPKEWSPLPDPSGPYDKWFHEFGAFYRPPTELIEFAQEMGLHDSTWAGDGAPSYSFLHDTGDLRIWFHMPGDVNERYGVIFYRMEGSVEVHVRLLLGTPSLDEAILMFTDAMDKLKSGKALSDMVSP